MPEPVERPRSLCIVAAVPLSLGAFMAPHVRVLQKNHHITLVATSRSEAVSALCGDNVTFYPVTIPRGMSIVGDLRALIGLWRLFRSRRFDLVHSITPKAGLLTMVAGLLAGVPLRVHWFTGQVWSTRRGAGRWVLKRLDGLLVACSTDLLADSASQRAFLEQEGIVRPGQVGVLGQGSVCGVDLERFRPDAGMRASVRRRFGIPEDGVVALYLGRLTRDKGLRELAAAFASAASRCPDLYLLLVGPDEERLRPKLERAMAGTEGRVRFVEHTDHPDEFMSSADFFVLPSYREGFESTVIEAAACGTPAIASRIYGVTDAVVDGETGVLVPVGDVAALSAAIHRLASDPQLCHRLGAASRQRVERHFTQAQLTSALATFYDRLLTSVPREP